MRDEAEIRYVSICLAGAWRLNSIDRGHRRTYVASGPGAIVQALRKAGRNDPVILL